MDALGVLAGHIAHDFNNILTAIKGGVAFALEDLPPDHPVRPDLDQVVVAAERATALTRRLLTFGRRHPARNGDHDLGAVVAAMEPALRRHAGDDVELVVARGAETVEASVDPAQLEDVLVELVANARAAMPDGGRITISVDRVARSDTAAGEWARIVVADTGPGVPEEARAHVFEPFFTTRHTGVGGGLGLSVAYGIVRKGGGEILLDDSSGPGARFVIHLPPATGEHGADETRGA